MAAPRGLLLSRARQLASLGLAAAVLAVGCTSGGDSSRLDLHALSLQAAGSLRAAASDLGRATFDAAHRPPEEAVDSYIDVVGRTATLFGGPVVVRNTSEDDRKVTPLVLAGLELTVTEVAKAVPGGIEFPDESAKTALVNIDARTAEKRFRRLPQDDRSSSFRDRMNLLVLLPLFSDQDLVKQLVAPGAELTSVLSQRGLVGENGQVRIPAPPVDAIASGPWVAFLRAVYDTPPITRIRQRAVLRHGWPL